MFVIVALSGPKFCHFGSNCANAAIICRSFDEKDTQVEAVLDVLSSPVVDSNAHLAEIKGGGGGGGTCAQ